MSGEDAANAALPESPERTDAAAAGVAADGAESTVAPCPVAENEHDAKRAEPAFAYERVAAKRFKAAMEGGHVRVREEAKQDGALEVATGNLPHAVEVIENMHALFGTPPNMRTRHVVPRSHALRKESEEERALKRYTATVALVTEIFGYCDARPPEKDESESGGDVDDGVDALHLVQRFVEELDARSNEVDQLTSRCEDFEKKFAVIEQLTKKLENVGSADEVARIRAQFESQLNVELCPIPPLVSQQRIEASQSNSEQSETVEKDAPLRLIKL
ncbi:hypothetical protein FVE85_4166 [Porphyridium purpureum]|uniref:Uncharacterized protein n=1 Tax=Porphyridium purpureum TaxID=35688 RepID=A0A5J4YRS0_PORPP|nr:hypothetical protein FVE85_4166 [Porphyridium purpureum]|eukprot:POR7131..scf229_5